MSSLGKCAIVLKFQYFSRRLSVGIAATSCFVLFLLGMRWIDKDEPIVVADTLSVEAAEEHPLW